jgi:hypothetical protein
MRMSLTVDFQNDRMCLASHYASIDFLPASCGEGRHLFATILFYPISPGFKNLFTKNFPDRCWLYPGCRCLAGNKST